MNIKQTLLRISAVIMLATALATIGLAGNVAQAEVKCGFDARTGEPVCAEQGGPGGGGGSGVTIVDEPPASAGESGFSGDITYPGDNECDGVQTSIIGDDNLCGTAGENGKLLGILIWVIRIMSIGVGIAAVGGVIYAALLYTSAGPRTEQVKKATQMFVNITIGLLVWGLSVAIINFLVPGGVFR